MRCVRTTCALLAAATGCLGPLSEDDVPPHLVLPPGTVLPSIYDDYEDAQEIDEHDGVGALVPLLSGFDDGGPVGFWDFGPATDYASPLYLLVRDGADGPVPVGHTPIVGSIPGYPGYTPFWTITFVPVTDAYRGEIIPSVEALQEARGLGLVDKPMAPTFQVNCPIVADGVLLEVGGGDPPAPPTGHFIFDGQVGNYFDFGPGPIAADLVHVPIGERYRLRREGGEPLSEPVRGVDMTGDGDVADSNDVFAVDQPDDQYTALARIVEVTVPADYRSIDTSGDQTDADYRDAGDLFDSLEPRTPVQGHVVSFTVTDELRNCPLQREAP